MRALQKDSILVYQREGCWIISGSDKQLLASQEDTEIALCNASTTLTAREHFNAQWSLYVPYSGHYMYRTVVTICTVHWSLYVPPVLYLKNPTFCPHSVRGGAAKSLARPGRKQAAATKPGIYSAHSPRSSIHFLARCSNFCKPLKKNSEVVRPTRSPRQK